MSVLEVAQLSVDPGKSTEFESEFEKAIEYVRAADGHIDSSLERELETPGEYLFIVRWRALADHVETFVVTDGFRSFNALIGSFLTREPSVKHFEDVQQKESAR